MSDRDQVPTAVAMLCYAYVGLRCGGRILARADHQLYADVLRDAAEFIADEAPGQAFPDLDAVKRILEIDESVTDVALVLQRASIPMPGGG
jgi:poly-gamma-glutamate capsule biosynthesis protein CapA/YwtB (metallophosphatase superfamily)